MVLGVARLQLMFPASSSLKEKRRSLRRILDRAQSKFNVAIAEVGDLDSWQRSTIGVCVVGNETRHVQSMQSKVLSFVESLQVGQIVNTETELVHYSDSEPIAEY